MEFMICMILIDPRDVRGIFEPLTTWIDIFVRGHIWLDPALGESIWFWYPLVRGLLGFNFAIACLASDEYSQRATTPSIDVHLCDCF